MWAAGVGRGGRLLGLVCVASARHAEDYGGGAGACETPPGGFGRDCRSSRGRLRTLRIAQIEVRAGGTHAMSMSRQALQKTGDLLGGVVEVGGAAQAPLAQGDFGAVFTAEHAHQILVVVLR